VRYIAVKRALDFLVALCSLFALLPLFLIVALMVKATSNGGIFFVQSRLGRDGNSFLIYKFRTMTAVERKAGGEVFLDDDEITGIGRFLRRFKLDELPQLLNIIRGEMSFIGPRPALLDDLESYDQYVIQRLAVLPGLSGLAQVHGNIHLSWAERWEYDVEYVENFSPSMDLKILFRTIQLLLIGERAMYERYHYERS